MSSLKDSIAPLESDLKAVPPRISVYHDLPFAIMRYNPTDEWELRREIKLLATRLEAAGKDVHIIPMSELLWSALEQVRQKDDDEGLEAIIALEKDRGFAAAQHQVTTYLSSSVWVPLWDLLAQRLNSVARFREGEPPGEPEAKAAPGGRASRRARRQSGSDGASPSQNHESHAAAINPENSVVFLTRVAAIAPGIFNMSMLLDKMQGKTRVPTILFYPGSIEGTTALRFMDLKDRDALGNYRVKIYG